MCATPPAGISLHPVKCRWVLVRSRFVSVSRPFSTRSRALLRVSRGGREECEAAIGTQGGEARVPINARRAQRFLPHQTDGAGRPRACHQNRGPSCFFPMFLFVTSVQRMRIAVAARLDSSVLSARGLGRTPTAFADCPAHERAGGTQGGGRWPQAHCNADAQVVRLEGVPHLESACDAARRGVPTRL